MNINNALLDVYKKRTCEIQKRTFIYKMRLGKYEDLNIPPTEEEINNEMIENTFKEAYEEEQNNKNGDIERVNILLKRLTKPTLNPYLTNVINNLETLINKIEQQQNINNDN